jgi:hypothetical protein
MTMSLNAPEQDILDPLSDRYRVCPNCKTPHMVRNRGRDFCSDRCADQHYNARRRLLKQAEPKTILEQNPLPIPPMEENMSVTVQSKIESTQPEVTDYQKNLQILNSVTIKPEVGTVYHIDDLIRAGFNFDAFSGRGILHNIDPKLNCHFVQYGTYRLYRVDYSHVLIHRNEPLKTTKDD